MTTKRDNMRWLRERLEAGDNLGLVAREYNEKFCGGRRAMTVDKVKEWSESFKEAAPRAPSSVRTNRCGIFGRL